MATFGEKAREQAVRVLTYAAASGTAALVDLATGESELSIGDRIDAESKQRAARQLRDSDEQVLAISPTEIAGRVGSGFALVVWLDSSVRASAVCADRVARACALLTRMLRPGSAAPSGGSQNDPSDGSGAPAELGVIPFRKFCE